MKRTTILIALFATALTLSTDVSAQGFLGKLKDKASKIANDAVDKKIDKAVGIDNQTQNTGNDGNSGSTGGSSMGGNTTARSGRAMNKGGEGLKNSTAPDVNQQIAEAETAYTSANYSEARYSIQQALLGIELQMGKEILRSLPATVASLPADTTEDKVASQSWGWSTLTIQRLYKKDDKELTIMVGNNSIYGNYLNILFAGNMMQSNGETQNFKQIKIKGNKAVIKYEQSEGYTVMVQIGQSGMITFQGVNFANEQEMTAAVNSFDIDGIKRMLGEK